MAIAIDASTPVKVSSATNTSAGHTAVTTASFTPPSGAKLLAFCGANNPGAGQTHTPVVSGGSLSWTKIQQVSNGQNSGTDGMAAIFYADVVSSAAMTVTLDDGNASAGTTTGWDAYLKVVVLTGAATGLPPSGVAHVSTATGTPTGTLTVSANSALFAVNSDWNASGAATATSGATTVYDEYLSAGQISIHVFRSTSLALSAGSNTIAITPATQQYNLVVIEVQVPGASSTSGDVYWPLVRARATGPRQISGPYSRQFQFGVDAVATVSASGTGSITLDGGIATVAAAATATASLTLTSAASASGQAVATGALSLTATAPASASPTATGSLSLTGTAAWTEPASAALTLTASSTASGSPAATGALSLTATGSASASPTATGALALTATGTAKAAATGSAALALNATGTAQAPAVGTGALSLNATGNATAAGTHTGALSLTGTATAQAAATATGALALTAVGTSQAPAVGTGALTLTASGTPRAAGTGTGALSLLGSLTARAQAAGTALLSLLGLGAATGGGIVPTVRGWSTTGTTSPSSSTSQTDTTTTSKATVTIL